MLLSAPSVTKPRKASEFEKARGKDLYNYYQYADNVIGKLNRQKQTLRKREKNAFAVSDITEEEDIDIQDEVIHYRELKLSFKVKNAISALVSGVPVPPDPPSKRLERTTLLTQIYFKEGAKALDEIKKEDAKYFQLLKQQQKVRKQRAKFEAQLDNIFFGVGGQLMMAGAIYVVGPFVVPYIMSGMATAAGDVAVAATTVHGLTSQIGKVENARNLLGTILNAFQPPTPEAIAGYLSANPGATEASAIDFFKKAFFSSEYIKANPGTSPSLAESIASEATQNLQKLMSDRDSAIGALNTIQQTFSNSKGWKTYATRIIAEVFLGLNPAQMTQMQTMLSEIQTNTLNLIISDPQIAANPSIIFDTAFNGKNPLTAGFPGFGGLTAEDLKSYRRQTNAGGFAIENIHMKSYQTSVLKYTNFLNEIALGPLASYFVKFNTDKLTDLDPSILASDVEDIVNNLKLDPNWKPSFLEEKAIELFSPGLGLSPETVKRILKTKEFILFQKANITEVIAYFQRYRSNLQPIYALFFPPENFQPEVREPLMRTLWNRVKTSTTIRAGYQDIFTGSVSSSLTGFKNFFLRSFGFDEAAFLETFNRVISDKFPSLPKDGMINGAIYFFAQKVKDAFSPDNLIGYVGNCSYDALANKISATVEDYLPPMPEIEETEEDRERKKEEEEKYEEGIHAMRVMYLAQGMQGEPLAKLIRDHKMRTQGKETLDEENMNMLEYTFLKIQQKAGELSQKNLPGTIFFFLGTSTLVSLVNEVLSFHLKPSAKGDNNFDPNASLGRFDFYNGLTSPMFNLLLGYLQSSLTAALADLAQSFQAAYKKIYEDVYDKFIRKPLMNSEVVQYINQNIRRNITNVTSRVLNRIYLGVYIENILNPVIDLFFDTLIQLPMSLPAKGILDFQTYLYDKYKDISIAGIQPVQISKYIVPSGWESVVQSLDGKTLLQIWSRLQSTVAETGFFGENIQLRSILSGLQDGITDDIFTQYSKKGFGSISELFGTDYREIYSEFEESIVSLEDKFTDAKTAIVGLVESEESRNARLRVPLSELQTTLSDQITYFLSVYNDPKKPADEKAYVYQRIQVLTGLYINTMKEIDIIDGKKALWTKEIKQSSTYNDLPQHVRTVLRALQVPDSLVSVSLSSFDLSKMTASEAPSLFRRLIDNADRPILDVIYSMTSFVTGERRYDDSVEINLGGDRSIVLTGNDMKTFNTSERQSRFASECVEQYLINHYGDSSFNRQSFEQFVRDRIVSTGFLIRPGQIDALVNNALQRYMSITYLAKNYGSIPSDGTVSMNSILTSFPGLVSDPVAFNKLAQQVQQGFTHLKSTANVAQGGGALTAEQIRDLCRFFRRQDAQDLTDLTIGRLVPDYLKETARQEQVALGLATRGLEAILGIEMQILTRKSISHIPYISVGENQYYKVEEISAEEALASSDPMERYLNVRITHVQPDDIPADIFRDIRTQDQFKFKSLRSFKNSLSDYLLGDFSKKVNKKDLFITRTYESFGLFNNMFITRSDIPADSSLPEDIADGVYILLGGSKGGFTVDKNSELYKRLETESRTNPAFARSISDYVRIPNSIKLIDDEIDRIVNSWDAPRRNAHFARMRDLNAGFTGQIDADIAGLYQAKKALQKELNASYDSAMNSLPKSLQDALRYNRDRALEGYVNRIDAVINNLQTKDIPLLDSIIPCDDSTSESADVSSFKEAYTDISGATLPEESTIKKPENMDGMARWINDAELGCIKKDVLDNIRVALQRTLQECERAKSEIKGLIGLKSGSLDLRAVFNKVLDLEDKRAVARLELPALSDQNTKYRKALDNIRSKLPEMLTIQGQILALQAKELDTETLRDAKGQQDQARRNFEAIPEMQRGLPLEPQISPVPEVPYGISRPISLPRGLGPYVKYDDIIVELKRALRSSEYGKKPDESPAEYVRRMKDLLSDADTRKDTLGARKLDVGSSLSALRGGSTGFASLLTYMAANKKSYDLSGVPNLRDAFKDSPLLTSEKEIFDDLLRENDDLRRSSDAYMRDWIEVQRILNKYKGVELDAELLDYQKEDFAMLQSLLSRMDRILQSDLNDFARRATNKIDATKESHRTKVSQAINDILREVPLETDLDEEISLVQDLIEGYTRSGANLPTSNAAVAKRELQERLTYLTSLRDNIRDYRRSLNDSLGANKDQILDLKKLQDTWTNSFKDIINHYKTNTEARQNDNNAKSTDLLAQMRTKMLSIQTQGDLYLAGLKGTEKSPSAFKQNWQKIYDHFLAKYGTRPSFSFSRKEPLGSDTPAHIVAIMRKARAYLNIGNPEDQDPTLLSFYTFSLPPLDNDPKNIQANLHILDSAEDILSTLQSSYPNSYDYLDAKSYMEDDQDTDKLKAQKRKSSRNQRNAIRRGLGTIIGNNPEWISTGEKLQEISDDKKAPFTTRYDALTQEYRGLLEELNQVRNRKAPNGSALSQDEMDARLRELKNRRDRIFGDLTTLNRDIIRHLDNEKTELTGQIKRLLDEYTQLETNLGKIKGFGVGWFENDVTELERKLNIIEGLKNKWNDDETKRDPSIASSSGLRNFVDSLRSQINALKPDMDTKLASKEAVADSKATEPVNTKKTNILQRYDNMVSAARSRVTEYESEVNLILTALLKSPKDLRLQAIYAQALEILNEAKGYLQTLEDAKIPSFPTRNEGETFAAYIDRIQKAGLTLLPRNPDESETDYVTRLQNQNTGSFIDLIRGGEGKIPLPNTNRNEASILQTYLGAFTIFLNSKKSPPSYKKSTLTGYVQEANDFVEGAVSLATDKYDTLDNLIRSIDDIRRRQKEYNDFMKKPATERAKVSNPPKPLSEDHKKIFDRYEKKIPDEYAILTSERNAYKKLVDFLNDKASTAPKTRQEFEAFFAKPENAGLARKLLDLSMLAGTQSPIKSSEKTRIRSWLTGEISTVKADIQRLESQRNALSANDRASPIGIGLTSLIEGAKRELALLNDMNTKLDTPDTLTPQDNFFIRVRFNVGQRKNLPAGTLEAPGEIDAGVLEGPAEEEAGAEKGANVEEAKPAEDVSVDQALASGQAVKEGESLKPAQAYTNAVSLGTSLSAAEAAALKAAAALGTKTGQAQAVAGPVEGSDLEIDEEEKPPEDKPEDQPAFDRGDIGIMLYQTTRDTFSTYMDKYHKNPDGSLDKYDFSFVNAPNGLVSSQDFKQHLIREIAIDIFFESNEDIVHNSQEGEDLRRAARGCIKLQTGKAKGDVEPSCTGISDDRWEKIKRIYEKAFKPANEGGNRIEFLSDVFTAGIFEDLPGKERNASLYLGREHHGLDLGDIASLNFFQTDPSKSKSIDERVRQYFDPKDKQARATHIGAALSRFGRDMREGAAASMRDKMNLTGIDFTRLFEYNMWSDWVQNNPGKAVTVAVLGSGAIVGIAYGTVGNYLDAYFGFNSIKIGRLNTGIGPLAATGAVIGTAAGGYLAYTGLVAAGFSGPQAVVTTSVLVIGGVIYFAWDTAKWAIGSGIEHATSPSQKEGETDAEYRARINAIADNAIYSWGNSATADDFRQFGLDNTKARDIYFAIRGSTEEYILEALNKNEIPDTIRNKIAEQKDGKWVFKTGYPWYDLISEEELGTVLRAALQLTLDTNNDTNNKKGGAVPTYTKPIYRTTPFLDVLDTAYLYMVLNSYYDLQKGMSPEEVQKLISFRYCMYILPVWREIINSDFNFETIPINVLLYFPYKFLKGIQYVGDKLPSLTYHMYDSIYHRVPLTAEDIPLFNKNPAYYALEPAKSYVRRMQKRAIAEEQKLQQLDEKERIKEEKRKQEEDILAYLEEQKAKKVEQAEQKSELLVLFDKYKSINADLQTKRTTYILNRLLSRITYLLFSIYEDYMDDDETIEEWFDATLETQKKLFKTIQAEYSTTLKARDKIKNEVQTFRDFVYDKESPLSKEQVGIFYTITTTNSESELNRLSGIVDKIQTIEDTGKIRGKSIKTPNLEEDVDKCYQEFRGTDILFTTIGRSNEEMIACFRNIIKERSEDYIQILFKDNKKIMDPLMEGLDKVSYQYGGVEPLESQAPRVKRNHTRKLLKNTSSR